MAKLPPGIGLSVTAGRSHKVNLNNALIFWFVELQPLLDIAIYVQKLTGAIGMQVWYYFVCKGD